MNILLIGDNKQILENLGNSVESLGFSCKKFTNPERAVEAYNSGDYDLVVTDFEKSLMNGMEVIKAIRINNPLAMAFMLRGIVSIKYFQETICDLQNIFFTKPFDKKDFIATLSG